MSELKIKPLMRYEVTHSDPYAGQAQDTFTADGHIVDEQNVIFFRTGNIIRQYLNYSPMKIVITPDEEAEVQE